MQWPGTGAHPGARSSTIRLTITRTFDSRLTITLRPDPAGGTLLTLIHEQLGELAAAMPQVAENVGPGWEATLGKLAGVLAREA